MMARGKKHSEGQILGILMEIEAGATIASVALAHGITGQTIQRWRNRNRPGVFGDQDELRLLQEENQRLRRIVARQALEIDAYREVTGTW